MRTIALLLLGLGTCAPILPPPDAAPVEVDASVDVVVDVLVDGSNSDVDTTPCGLACARLEALGCEEQGPLCSGTCEHILATGLTRFDTSCVAQATNKAEVRLCPAIRCKD